MEINYKAWDEARKEWIPGNLLFMDYDGQVLAGDIYNPPFTLISPKNVVINTGLKDKNGREIYEGDVLEITLGEGSSIRCVIEYKAPSFCRRWIDKVSKYRRPSEIEKMAWNTHIIYKIIGNIYENPELLEVAE